MMTQVDRPSSQLLNLQRTRRNREAGADWRENTEVLAISDRGANTARGSITSYIMTQMST